MELAFNKDSFFVKLLSKLISQHSNKKHLYNNKYSFTSIGIDNDHSNYNITKNELIELLKNVVKLMEHLNLKCSPLSIDDYIFLDNSTTVSFHHAHATTSTVNPDTCIHIDDECLIPHKVHTFIIYDNNDIVGGEFAIYSNENNVNDNTFLFNKNENEFEMTRKIKTCYDFDDSKQLYKALVFSSDTIHNSLPLEKGDRYALSVQIIQG